MGRGRQKAKHTKVARELKYFSPDTNYSALERELGTHSEPDFAALAAKYDTDDEADDLDDPGLGGSGLDGSGLDGSGLDDADDFDDDAGAEHVAASWVPGDEQKRA